MWSNADTECLKLGAVHTLLKPFSLDVIRGLVEELDLSLLNDNDQKPNPLSLRLREILQDSSVNLTTDMESTLLEAIASMKALGN
jgi:hypothetical protein